ncbi:MULTISPECIES: quinol oxidase subunit 4 [unclassified Sphingobacterium]|uniref:quinol oxidase subunit 4 n=1 Tax=unclassified Sphingobacterium TaxID=2609468 RepID=UPI0025FDB9E5|nr:MULTISPECIES: quinol oxidase subunit 4 [unclassified Sphingobacterium]
MKKTILYVSALVFVLGTLGSCATHHSQGRGNGGMPPGQAKKVYGKKSAKEFAPGQQKKNLR